MQLLKRSLARLLLVYVSWTAANIFGSSLLYLYFKNAGLSEFELLSSFIFSFVATLGVVLILDKRKTDFRVLMVVALAFMAIAYLLLFFLNPTKELLLLYNVLLGSTFFLFWVPLNIFYFERTRRREAQLSAVYFSMSPFLGLIIPLASALVVENLGFNMLFLLTSAAYVATMVTMFLLEKRRMFYDLKTCHDEIKGFKTLILVEGVYGGGLVAATTLIALFYFTKPLELGAFLSITTIFSVIASFIIGELSDKARKRKKYIDLFGAGMGITTGVAFLASGPFLWYAAMSIRNFFAALFFPFTTAIIIDNKKDMEKSMVSREFILNLGRIIGVGIVLLCAVAFGNIYLSLVFLGLVILGYPLILELKKKHIAVE